MTQQSKLEVQHSVLVYAKPETVYDAFTTTEHLNSWFTTGSEVDPRPGGQMIWRWVDWGPDKDTAEDRGPVLIADRPQRYAFQWRKEQVTVDLTFEAVDEGTIVRLREYGYEATLAREQVLVGSATGWGEALTLLKFYVEHGITYDSALAT
ncbi:SRPBCC domain-containing protein [Chloroflexi bacterium TSY]|nr:SRPBCC domain-containing protein [Chloroflexi bacterium TSY]